MYFGGFDPNGYTSTNKAWIYKKVWNTLDIDQKRPKVMSDYKIHDNYPNPFNPSTNIPYTILIGNFISISIKGACPSFAAKCSGVNPSELTQLTIFLIS